MTVSDLPAVNAALTHPLVWVLFVCAAASAGFQGMDWPARRAALPMLVSDDDVTAAVTLQTTTMALSMVVGPAVGGVLIARLGLTTVYLIDVATFAVSFTVCWACFLVPTNRILPPLRTVVARKASAAVSCASVLLRSMM